MRDQRGDPAKQPESCRQYGQGACENLKETSSPTDFAGETYSCEVCGECYRLLHEDTQ